MGEEGSKGVGREGNKERKREGGGRKKGRCILYIHMFFVEMYTCVYWYRNSVEGASPY